MSKGYVLQYGQIAGMSYNCAQALKSAGVNSVHVVPDDFDYPGLDPDTRPGLERHLPYDRALSPRSAGKFSRFVSRLKFIKEVLRDCRLIHYQGATILRNLDIRLFASRGIPMIVSFAGGEARIISEAKKKNPYFYHIPFPGRDKAVYKYLKSTSRFIRYAATDCELGVYAEPYFKKVFTLRQPIDINESRCVFPEADEKKPIVLHTPTDSEVKGTSFILAAVEQLKSEGLSFEFKLQKPNLTQERFKELLSTVDIVVDELRCGSHGITAVESMASGKPTLTHIRDDLVAKYPEDMPIVRANPDTICDRLRELVVDGDKRRETGIRSRRYVEKYHALEVIGQDLLGIYKQIGL